MWVSTAEPCCVRFYWSSLEADEEAIIGKQINTLLIIKQLQTGYETQSSSTEKTRSRNSEEISQSAVNYLEEEEEESEGEKKHYVLMNYHHDAHLLCFTDHLS